MPLLLIHFVLLLFAVAANGVVKIRSEPDATVFWNEIALGKVGPNGALTVKDLPPGIYRVTIQKEGYKTVNTQVKVTPGEQTVELSLEKEPASGMAGTIGSSPPLGVSAIPSNLADRLTPGLTRSEPPPPPQKRARSRQSPPPLKLDLTSPFDPPEPEEAAEVDGEAAEIEADLDEEEWEEASVIPVDVQERPAAVQAGHQPREPTVRPTAEEAGSKSSLAVVFLLCLLAGLYYLIFWNRSRQPGSRPASESDPKPAECPFPEPGPYSTPPGLSLASRRSLSGEEELFFLDDLKRREKEMDQPVEQEIPQRKRPPVIDITPHAARFEDEG
jgi:hypothetical protein